MSKRKDSGSQDLTEPPAKKSRVVHHGPSTTTVPGFATGRQVLRSVPDTDEDWGEEEEEDDDDDDEDDDDDDDELALESEVDVEEGIIDYDDDDEIGTGLEDDDYDELAD